MMKMNDQQISAALSVAISELTQKAVAKLFMEGGALDLDFETGRAKLSPGERTKTLPYHNAVVDPDASEYPISSLGMWLPPFPGSEKIRRQPLTCSGWNILFEFARRACTESTEIWIRRLREIENGAISVLNSREPSTEAA